VFDIDELHRSQADAGRHLGLTPARAGIVRKQNDAAFADRHQALASAGQRQQHRALRLGAVQRRLVEQGYSRNGRRLRRRLRHRPAGQQQRGQQQGQRPGE